MENDATVINTLKYLNDADIVKFCSVNSKIRNICKKYSQLLLGMSYEDFMAKMFIQNQFPTLTDDISMKTLLIYYGSYSKILKVLEDNMYNGYQLPMCGEIFWSYEDENGFRIDPSPKNLKYMAPYHVPILYPEKNLTFLIFRGYYKIPTEIFTISENKPITAYHFAHYSDHYSRDYIIKNSKMIINSKKNREQWAKYINDPVWDEHGYSNEPLKYELNKVNKNRPCDVHFAYEFKTNYITELFERYFNWSYKVVQIEFD